MKSGRELPLLRIVAIAMIAVTLIVIMIGFALLDAEGLEAVSPIPRPTLPAGTPTHEVFLPLVQKAGTPGTPTPRPTLEG